MTQDKTFLQVKLLKAGLFVDAAAEALQDACAVTTLPENYQRVLVELIEGFGIVQEVLSQAAEGIEEAIQPNSVSGDDSEDH